MASLPNISLRRSSRPSVVGLDIEPGSARAVQTRVEGGRLVVERFACAPLGLGTVRDGEVADPQALADALRGLFDEHDLSRRVRIGVANQQIVMRHLLLPPISAARELDTAVRFMAADEIPMPVDQAAMDHVVLGPVDTPEGPRVRVLLVAARRSMIESLLSAARLAGLRPEGIDMSAFALIRAAGRTTDEVVLHVSVGGVVNLAATRGGECIFTRVIGGGMETMAMELAERFSITIEQARAALRAARLDRPATPTHEESEAGEDAALAQDAERVLSDGLRRMAGEIRNSIDFHLRADTGAGPGEALAVDQVLLAGPAAGIQGFSEALAQRIGLPVRIADLDGVAGSDRGHYTVAAGLSIEAAAA